MKDTISSPATFFFKFVFPGAIVGFPAVVTLLLFIDAHPAKWILLPATVALFLLMYWVCFRLKKVEVDDETLRISNFVTTHTVPIANVSDVKECPFISIHPVWLHFHTPTEFGRSIVFMPKTEWSPRNLFKSHRTVQDLKRSMSEADN